MHFYITEGWTIFCLLLGVIIVTLLIMNFLGGKFYTQDVVLRRFSIMDLQFPGSPVELEHVLKGIFELPADRSQKTLRALKAQLYLDFLFMPAAYGAIFILCMHVASKMSTSGQQLFSILAWAQLIALLCDVFENIFLLMNLKPGISISNRGVVKVYLILVVIKWMSALVALVCALSALFYFWLIGRYSGDSLPYLWIICAEVTLFVVLRLIIARKANELEKE